MIENAIDYEFDPYLGDQFQPKELTKRFHRDAMESLHLDSNLTPEQKKQIANEVKSNHTALLRLYGEYISNDRLLKDDQLMQTVIGLDEETYKVFTQEWLQSDSRLEYTSGPYLGRRFNSQEGDLIVFNSMDEEKVWGFLSPEVQASIIAQCEGDETKAHKIWYRIVIGHILIHEIIHNYQNDTMPLWFMECGAYYYANEVTKALYQGSEMTNGQTQAISFYQSLVDRFGSTVHHAYFNYMWENLRDRDEQSTKELRAVISSMDQDITKIKALFPDYQEVKSES